MSAPNRSHLPADVRGSKHTNAQPLLDAGAAGALLSVPASWMLREARAGRVPHVRLGRYVRFDAEALDAWWRSRVSGPIVRTGLHPVSVDGDRQ